tara:strand:+ start:3384 stop:3947 length:564 start_codon:yes stop_codon:yes gene_type:complete
MAHFARIKKQPNPFTSELEWTVQEVIVASNDIQTANGPLGDNDMHEDGETYVKNMFKHMYSENENVWKQTSYNNNFRNLFAGKTFVYLETADRFIEPQPHASWHLSNEDFTWKAPVAYPSIVEYDNPLAGQDILNDAGEVEGTQPDKAPYYIRWDEDQQKWYAQASHLNLNKDTHVWNVDTTSWDEV